MLFIVSGHDHLNVIARRLEFRTAHRAHYTDLGDDLILSGPYLDEDGEPIGSMIIMRRHNQEAAEAHVRSDPYVIKDVFADWSLRRWDWFMNRPEALKS